MYIRDKAHRPNANIMLTGGTEWKLWDHVKSFQAKRIKLAQDLLWIMAEFHKENVQHNDLSINNNMLHLETGGRL